MGKVLVTRPIPAAAIELLRNRHQVRVLEEGEALESGQLRAALADADGVLGLLTERFDEDTLEAAGSLRVLANMAVGYDNVDVAAATRRGILVTNTPEVLTETTADLTFALLLAIARRLREGDRLVREGGFDRWGPLMLLGQEVAGSTLGIAGLGRIGEAVARRGALGFGMRVLYWDLVARPEAERTLNARQVSREELFRESDFLTLHLPLDDSTRHFADAQTLSLMKPTAVLINTSRGPVIDEQALVAALRAGQLWGAGLDVYEREPQLEAGLTELDNVLLLPHIGSASEATRVRMATLAAENLMAALAGERPPCLVDPEAWERRRR